MDRIWKGFKHDLENGLEIGSKTTSNGFSPFRIGFGKGLARVRKGFYGSQKFGKGLETVRKGFGNMSGRVWNNFEWIAKTIRNGFGTGLETRFKNGLGTSLYGPEKIWKRFGKRSERIRNSSKRVWEAFAKCFQQFGQQVSNKGIDMLRVKG